jgi:hypothetical protein
MVLKKKFPKDPSLVCYHGSQKSSGISNNRPKYHFSLPASFMKNACSLRFFEINRDNGALIQTHEFETDGSLIPIFKKKNRNQGSFDSDLNKKLRLTVL